MAKIVIVDDDPQVISYETDFFKSIQENNEIAVYKTRPSNSRELIQRVKDCHTIVVTKATTQITNSVIENSPNLRHIAVYGPALDHIDVDSANRNKIKVTSIPDILTNSVAEHTISLIMSLNKRIPELDRRIRGNEWPSIEVELLEGKTLGIIGSGAIGEKVARMGLNLGMKIIISPMLRIDKVRTLSFEEFAKVSDINFLLENSDVVSIHTRVVENTKYLIDTEQFSLMKSSAILVNTARGRLVNEEALYNSLIGGKISGAALDVFEKEPINENNKLKSLQNVIMTSHNAANSGESIKESINTLAKNITSNL